MTRVSAAGMPAAAAEPPAVIALPGWRDPLDVLSSFAADPMPVLLYSGAAPAAAADASRWSILCASPFDIIRWEAGQPEDPFRRIEAALGAHRSGPAGGLPFAGGAVGYFGYGAGRAVESIRSSPARREQRPGAAVHGDVPDGDVPDVLFGLYAWAIVWDHCDRSWWIVSTGLPGRDDRRRARARDDAEAIRARLASPTAGPPAARQAPGRPAPASAQAGALAQASAQEGARGMSRERYVAMVAQAQTLIAQGEVYQVNLSQRLELPFCADPVETFRGLTRKSAAPFSAYLDAGPFWIASASPERFCSLRGGRVECRPIKGTRPRGGTPDEDAALALALAASTKDRAENIMIVDLVRNDLGRVCSAGSVRVKELCRVESYASVHHLVSIVTGELGPGRDRADLLRALFPPGSMTGAPKVRAMQAIEDLEPVSRGVYAGALGYLSFCGAMDLSVVIRTALVGREGAWLSVGGGVVADSVPAEEWQESLDKAASVLRGLEAAWGSRRSSSRSRGPGTASHRSDR